MLSGHANACFKFQLTYLVMIKTVESYGIYDVWGGGGSEKNRGNFTFTVCGKRDAELVQRLHDKDATTGE